MSWLAVRDAARDLENVVGWPVLPYHDTIAVPAFPATTEWFTVEFNPETDEAIEIGGGPTPARREEGQIILALLGLSGNGDATLMAHAETIAPLIDPHFKSAGIAITRMRPPQVVEADGDVMRMDIVLDYERDHI